jgi:hypothetical protein
MKIPLFGVLVRANKCGVLVELATPLTWLIYISLHTDLVCYMTSEDALKVRSPYMLQGNECSWKMSSHNEHYIMLSLTYPRSL